MTWASGLQEQGHAEVQGGLAAGVRVLRDKLTLPGTPLPTPEGPGAGGEAAIDTFLLTGALTMAPLGKGYGNLRHITW